MKHFLSGPEHPVILAIVLASVIALASAASAQDPTVSIFTDKVSYIAGETIEVSLAGENPGLPVRVDVYVGLFTPDGAIYTLQPDGWADDVDPWGTDIELPAGFGMLPAPLWWFEIPCDMPPIAEAGEYSFASVLAAAGTFDWLCQASFAPFDVEPAIVQHYYVNAELGDDANDGSEGLPWQTIQHAVNSVEGSEATPVEIHVAAGTYYWGAAMKSWVSLIGEGADCTVLDGLGSARLVHCYEVHDLTIRGFTITGGHYYASGSHPDWGLGGAGIYCYKSSPTISDNIIMANEVEGPGSYGGYEPSGGGGIYCHLSAATISNNIIVSNSADMCGAGEGSGGAGIYCFKSSGVIVDNVIADNYVYTPFEGGGGGGICCKESSPVIANNVVVDNLVHGGAGFGGGVSCGWSSSPIMMSNTISGNEVRTSFFGQGAGVSARCDCSPIILDCVLWANRHNDIYEAFESECFVSYCCIEDGVPGEGNIHDDPLFVSGPLGDYYLDPLSPCVDAGSRSAEEAGLSDRTTQADGTPDAGIVDMGFHYSVP